MKTRIILIITLSFFFQSLIFGGDSIYYSNDDYKSEAAISKRSEITNNAINVFIDSNSAIHISVGGSYKKATAILFDLLGKETNKITITSSPDYIWNIAKGTKGIYLLKIQTEKTTFVKKVVIQ